MMSLIICCTRNSLVIIWLLSWPCCISKRSSWATTGSSSRQILLTCRLCSISLSSRGRSANAEMHDPHSISLAKKENENWSDQGSSFQTRFCGRRLAFAPGNAPLCWCQLARLHSQLVLKQKICSGKCYTWKHSTMMEKFKVLPWSFKCCWSPHTVWLLLEAVGKKGSSFSCNSNTSEPPESLRLKTNTEKHDQCL